MGEGAPLVKRLLVLLAAAWVARWVAIELASVAVRRRRRGTAPAL
jgi:hypothetical protein